MKSFTSAAYKILTAFMVVMLALAAIPAYAADTGFINPTASGAAGFTNPNNAWTNNAVYATVNADNVQQQYLNFPIPVIPVGSVINGIEIQVDGFHSSNFSARRSIEVELSWNNGTNWTAIQDTGNFATGADQTRTVGGVANNWGRTWAPGEFVSGTFRVRLTSNLSGGTTSIDYVAVRVTYTAPTAPTITSASATSFAVGQAGTFTVTATGVPAPNVYSVSGDPLPNGVTFNPATHILSGTPAVGTIGTYNLIFTVGNGVAPDATQNFILTIGQAPAITSVAATTFTVGSAGSFTITTTGIPIPPTISNGSALPNGVSFVNNGDGTATLSGTPAAGTGGTYNLNLTASNGFLPNATQTFVLTVNQAPAINSTNTATFTLGQNNNFTVTIAPGAYPVPVPANWSAAGLPAWATFNTTTHVLSGTPPSGSITGSPYAVTFTVTNAAGTSTQNFNLVVQKGPQTIAWTQALPTAFGSTYTVTPVSNNGAGKSEAKRS